MRYTGYCTCFIDENEEKVIFYDEIKDKYIGTVKISSKEEGVEIMNKWKEEAPANVICDIL